MRFDGSVGRDDCPKWGGVAGCGAVGVDGPVDGIFLGKKLEKFFGGERKPWLMRGEEQTPVEGERGLGISGVCSGSYLEGLSSGKNWKNSSIGSSLLL
jgi:hypothetical protein